MVWKAYYVTKNKGKYRFQRMGSTTRKSRDLCLKEVSRIYRLGKLNYRFGRFLITSKALTELTNGSVALNLTSKFSIV